MRDLNTWKKSELLALPSRKWDDDTQTYDSLLIVSTGKKHDSGWAMIAIIGVRERQPVEVAVACADDIEWKINPALFRYTSRDGSGFSFSTGQFRSDCAWRSGALHVWTRDNGKFRVGAALSSTVIELLAP